MKMRRSDSESSIESSSESLGWISCEECREYHQNHPSQCPRTCQSCHHFSASHHEGRKHICPHRKCTKWSRCSTKYEKGHKAEVKKIKKMEKLEKQRKHSFINPDLENRMKGRTSEQKRAIVCFNLFFYFYSFLFYKLNEEMRKYQKAIEKVHNEEEEEEEKQEDGSENSNSEVSFAPQSSPIQG